MLPHKVSNVWWVGPETCFLSLYTFAIAQGEVFFLSPSQTIDEFCIGAFASIVSGGKGTEAGVKVVEWSPQPSRDWCSHAPDFQAAWPCLSDAIGSRTLLITF